MGQKTVRFSDLSGQLMLEDGTPARIVVHEHPGLADGPVEIEALTSEAEAIEQSGVPVAVVDVYLPGDPQPRRVFMEAGAFDKLATDKPMSELLAGARPARRASRSSAAPSARDDRLNYATIEHAGKPHKGKITDAERQLVREHLDQINDRLAAEGLRTISLTDPEHVGRYGLDALAAQQAPGRHEDPGQRQEAGRKRRDAHQPINAEDIDPEDLSQEGINAEDLSQEGGNPEDVSQEVRRRTGRAA